MKKMFFMFSKQVFKHCWHFFMFTFIFPLGFIKILNYCLYLSRNCFKMNALTLLFTLVVTEFCIIVKPTLVVQLPISFGIGPSVSFNAISFNFLRNSGLRSQIFHLPILPSPRLLYSMFKLTRNMSERFIEWFCTYHGFV